MSRVNFDRCRERDERIIERATRHIIAAKHVFGEFSCPQAAYRRLSILRKRGRLKHLGSVQLRGEGRPLDVYGNGFNVNGGHLVHELLLTDFLLCYEERAQVIRDPSQVHQSIHPDAEMMFSKSKRFFFVELDTGTEDLKIVERKWERAYRGVKDFLLVVTLSPVRMDNLIGRAGSIRQIALFATLDAVLADPHGEVYRDAFGNTAAI